MLYRVSPDGYLILAGLGVATVRDARKSERRKSGKQRRRFFLRLAAISVAIVLRARVARLRVGWLLFLPLIHADWSVGHVI